MNSKFYDRILYNPNVYGVEFKQVNVSAQEISLSKGRVAKFGAHRVEGEVRNGQTLAMELSCCSLSLCHKAAVCRQHLPLTRWTPVYSLFVPCRYTAYATRFVEKDRLDYEIKAYILIVTR